MYTWKFFPGNFSHDQDLTVWKLFQFCTYIKHEARVIGHLNSEDSFCGPLNQDKRKWHCEVGLKASSSPILIPRFLGLGKLLLGADTCVSRNIYILQLCLDNHQNTDIAEYYPDFEIRKPFKTSTSFWWVWLATHWCALQALSSWNYPHSLAFCGFISCCWECMRGVLANAISCTNLMTFSLFFSSIPCQAKTLVHFESVMKTALCKYHSLHCFEVVLSTCSLSASLKDNKLTTSSFEMLGWFLITSFDLVVIISLSVLLSVVLSGSSLRSVSASILQ